MGLKSDIVNLENEWVCATEAGVRGNWTKAKQFELGTSSRWGQQTEE